MSKRYNKFGWEIGDVQLVGKDSKLSWRKKDPTRLVKSKKIRLKHKKDPYLEGITKRNKKDKILVESADQMKAVAEEFAGMRTENRVGKPDKKVSLKTVKMMPKHEYMRQYLVTDSVDGLFRKHMQSATIAFDQLIGHYGYLLKVIAKYEKTYGTILLPLTERHCQSCRCEQLEQVKLVKAKPKKEMDQCIGCNGPVKLGVAYCKKCSQ